MKPKYNSFYLRGFRNGSHLECPTNQPRTTTSPHWNLLHMLVPMGYCFREDFRELTQPTLD